MPASSAPVLIVIIAPVPPLLKAISVLVTLQDMLIPSLSLITVNTPLRAIKRSEKVSINDEGAATVEQLEQWYLLKVSHDAAHGEHRRQ